MNRDVSGERKSHESAAQSAATERRNLIFALILFGVGVLMGVAIMGSTSGHHRAAAITTVTTATWLYDGSHVGYEMEHSDLVLFGEHGRIWTGVIHLASCQKYRKGRGYPPCAKDDRRPGFNG